jgi:ABC-2 type transport system permease protein
VSTVQTLIGHRRTIGLMVRQELKVYYSRYRLGLLWTMAEPFMQAMFMWVVFAFIFGSTRGITLEPFAVYLITGLLPLGWLQRSVSGGPRTLRKYGQALATSRLPAVAWPLRTVLTAMVDMLAASPVVVLLVVSFHLFTGEPSVGWGLVLAPVAVMLQLVFCMGMCMIGLALSVHFPDVDRMTGIINRFFFWMSPVLWSQRNFPEWVQPWLYLNPFHAILDFYRAAFWPEVLAPWQSYAMSVGIVLAVFVVGVLLMRSRVSEMRRFV